jgi:serine/threonine-protein kinase
VAGESISAASAKLGGLGLNVSNPVYEYSDTVAYGSVIGTNPGAGTTVSAGDTVTLYVSNGVQQVAVPDLSGDTGSQAQTALSAVGLQIAVTNVPTTDQTQNDMVIGQNPSAGTRANIGSTVTVQLGQYSAPTSTTTSTTAPSASTTTSPTT